MPSGGVFVLFHLFMKEIVSHGGIELSYGLLIGLVAKNRIFL